MAISNWQNPTIEINGNLAALGCDSNFVSFVA